MSGGGGERKSKSGPLLSVVIPVFNVEDYLDRCIKSIKGQTYSNMEIILSDDGSTDCSGMMCDAYAIEDDRIKVIHKRNGGQVSARKAGLREAVGEYITYVDSDDWIEKDMYYEMMVVMQELDADIVTSGCIRDYGTYCVVQRERISPGLYEKGNLEGQFLNCMIDTEAFFQPNITFAIWNKIYKKELLMQWQDQVDDQINVGDDVAMIYPCLLNAAKIAVSGENYYHYCMRNDSVMGSKKEDELQRYRVLFGWLEEECIKHKNRVPNIMDQIKLHECYLMLLKCADKVIGYKNGKLFPFGEIKQEERIVIYGAGRFGCELKSLLENRYDFKILAWVDRAARDGIQTAECLNDILYDKIIIAVLIADIAAEMRKELKKRGVSEEKILSVDPEWMKSVEPKSFWR